MRKLVIVLGLSTTLFLAVPAVAGMAVFKATALLRDHSERSIRTAILEAAEMGVRSAVAMGMPWVQLHAPLLMNDRVIVEVLATDTDPGDEEQAGPQPDDQSDAYKAPSGDPSGDIFF